MENPGGKPWENHEGYHWLWEHHRILVGGLEHFLFFHILGIILPTD